MPTSDLIETLEMCPACSSRRLEALPTPGRWIGVSVFGSYRDQLHLNRCGACGLVFVNPRPTAALLDRFYQGNEYGCHLPNWSEEAEATARAQLDWVDRLVPTGGRFLDFGCGGGYLLRNALARGWQALGYDVGAPAIAQCRQQGLPVTDNFDDLVGHGFDVVYLSHVLEHVGEPGPLLDRLRTLLAPGGRVFIEVPNARSLRARIAAPILCRWAALDERYRAFPIHLFYYSEPSLCAMLENHGMSVVGHTTRGVGLDELVFHEEHEPPPPMTSTAAPKPRGVGAKQLAKSVLYGATLGENLVVAAGATR